MLVHQSHDWASNHWRRGGAPLGKCWFVYRWFAKDGVCYDRLVEADYYTPQGATGHERTLKFPCPVCHMRILKGDSDGGEAMRYQDGLLTAPRHELTVPNSLKDWDVALDAFLTWPHGSDDPVPELRGKRMRYQGLVAMADSMRCTWECATDPDANFAPFDVTFPRIGLALQNPREKVIAPPRPDEAPAPEFWRDGIGFEMPAAAPR